jgi:hypothetical protein
MIDGIRVDAHDQIEPTFRAYPRFALCRVTWAILGSKRLVGVPSGTKWLVGWGSLRSG